MDERADPRRLSATHVAEAASPAVGSPLLGTPAPRLERTVPRAVNATAAERYRVEGLIGSGASADVFSLLDTGLGRHVAAKIMRAGARHDPQAAAQFVQEARITARLQHPSVLPVYDLDTTGDGDVCFTMRRIDGDSLQSLIETSTVAKPHARLASPNAVVTIYIAICHVMSYAHARNILHQDIKPHNILLGHYGEVLLLDWGSAIALGEADRSAVGLAGTPLYMAPEQARVEHASRQSDIYAIGASLFHTLTLRVPLWDADSETFYRKKRAGMIDPPTAAERARLPRRLLAIALKAMAARPQERYASVQALLADLEAFQSGMAVSAVRDRLWSVAARWYRANRRLSWVAALGLSALLLMAASLLYEKAKERAPWVPVFACDDCTPAALAHDWRALVLSPGAQAAEAALADEHHFRHQGAALRMHAALGGYTDLACVNGLLGNVRLEWDCTPLDDGHDLNAFLCGSDRTNGYTFHVASWDDPRHVVLTSGAGGSRLASAELPASFLPGHSYHFEMAYIDRRLLLSVDGQVLVDTVDSDELHPPLWHNLGLDCAGGNDLLVANLRLWHQPLAEKTTPLALAQSLADLGHLDEALAQCDDLIASYGGSDIEAGAQLLGGRCAMARGEDARAERFFLRFAALYSADPRLPFALAGRLALAWRLHPDEVETYRAQLLPYRGSPALKLALFDILGQLQAQLAAHAAPPLQDPWDAASLDALERELARMNRWCADYGVPVDATLPFFCDACATLARHRRGHAVLAALEGVDWAASSVLAQEGQLTEALACAPTSHARALLLIDLGRAPEVAGADYLIVDRIAGLYRAHGPAAALAASGLAPAVLPELVAPLLEGGGAAAALARADTDQVVRARLLLGLGRAREVLASQAPAECRREASFQLGDDVGALAPPESIAALARVAIARAGRGDLAFAAQSAATLRAAWADATSSDELFGARLLPALIDAAAGRTTAAQAALAALADEADGMDELRASYLARLAQGAIGSRQFLMQPLQLGAASRLAFAQGVGADVRGENADAQAHYREALRAPRWQSDLTPLELLWARMRSGLDPRQP